MPTALITGAPQYRTYIFSIVVAEYSTEMAFLPMSATLIKPPGIRADDAYVRPGRVA